MDQYFYYEVNMYDCDTEQQSIRQGVVPARDAFEARKKVNTFYPRRYITNIIIEPMEIENEKEEEV